MYLYDKNGDKIEVYSIIPNKAKIYRYKKEQIETIPKNERFFQAITNERLVLQNEIIGEGEIPFSSLNFDTGYVFHKLIPDNMTDLETERKTKLLESYCNQVQPTNVIKVKHIINEKSKFLLLMRHWYHRVNNVSDIYIMEDIMNIPKALYDLDLFFQEKYDLLKPEDFSDKRELFDIDYKSIVTFDYNEIKKLDEYGLTKTSEIEINNKLYETQKILSLIKGK